MSTDAHRRTPVSTERPSEADDLGDESELSGASLFTILWEAVSDQLGTAATAALFRRAAKRASLRCPELIELIIVRENLRYWYEVAPGWQERRARAPLALRELFAELRPILTELTGPVILKQILQVPALKGRAFS